MTLEEQIMEDVRNGRQVDIERALLIASGCETEGKIAEYKRKIDELESKFHAHSMHEFAGNKAKDETQLEKMAYSLDRFLWEKGNGRYNGNFLLADAVDAQINPETEGVGDCVGLSSLYAALGTRQGLKLAVLYKPEHIMLRLRIGRKTIDIECTDPYGFGIDIKQSRHKSHKGLGEAGLIALVTTAYYNRGIAKMELGRFQDAIADYDRAIKIMPDFALAYNNRGVAKYELGRFEDAIADYNKAIKIMPDFAPAYYNRGAAKEKLGDKEGAKEDMKMYRQLSRRAA